MTISASEDPGAGRAETVREAMSESWHRGRKCQRGFTRGTCLQALSTGLVDAAPLRHGTYLLWGSDMLTISDELASSFSAASVQSSRQNFVNWAMDLAGNFAGLSAETARLAFDRYLPEAEAAEIVTDQRLFRYMAARLMMPEMNGTQYLLVLDVVFSDAAQDECLQTFDLIRDQHG